MVWSGRAAGFGLGLLLLTASAAPGVAAGLIADGSFDRPELDPGEYYRTFVPKSKINTWIVTGPASGYVSLQAHDDPSRKFTVPEISGEQWLNLASSQKNNGVRQNVSVVANKSYRISFYIGYVKVVYPGGTPTVDPQATTAIYVDGQLLRTVAVATSSQTKLAWKHYLVTFKAKKTGKISIEFRNANSKPYGVNALDGIIMTAVAAGKDVEPLPAAPAGPIDLDRATLRPAD